MEVTLHALGAKAVCSLLTDEGRSHRQVMAKFKHRALILQQPFSIQRVGLCYRQSARMTNGVKVDFHF